MSDKIAKEFLKKYSNYWGNPRIGRVYCIKPIKGKERYIGSTSKTIENRFQSHISNQTASIKRLFEKYGKEGLVIELLWESKEPITRKKLREIEQSFIDYCENSVNIQSAYHNHESRVVLKGRGAIFRGEVFNTKLELWEKYGKVPLNTFKTRIHRGKSLEEALGIL